MKTYDTYEHFAAEHALGLDVPNWKPATTHPSDNEGDEMDACPFCEPGEDCTCEVCVRCGDLLDYCDCATIGK